jgi:ring-1,2-phenylacetyl-CoA epoxidase subunit PaaD
MVTDQRVPKVMEALREVPDPEIPVISVVELGIIHDITFSEERLRVDVLPTFVGCPALDLIRSNIRERLQQLHGMPEEVEVRITFAEPWTTDRISEEGRRKLELAGFAPPAERADAFDGDVADAACPYCGSHDTVLENRFGPTLCRAIHHCSSCNQPFEQFKTV